jgi:exonuclease SbcC
MKLLNLLQINNFLSHENTRITFGENEKLLIDGASGSGKSSITDSILWALYGKGRSEGRTMVRRGSKNATVSLRLADGERHTLISRSVTDKGKNTLAVTQNTGAEGQFLPIERTGIKDIQDWIENDLLKASYELFTNSIAYPQENENSFVKANASKRKDLLLEIVRVNSFDGLYEKARLCLQMQETNSAIKAMNIIQTEDIINKAKLVAEQYPVHKKACDEATATVETLTETEKKLELKINSINQSSKEIEDKKKMGGVISRFMLNTKQQIETIVNKIVEHESVDIKTHEENVKKADKMVVETEKISEDLKQNIVIQQKINEHLSNRPTVFDYTSEIEETNKRLIALMKETGKCPSGDNCPFLLPVRGQIEFLSNQLEEKASKTIIEKDNYDKWEASGKLLPVVQDSTGLYNKREEILSTIRILLKSKDVIKDFYEVQQTMGEIKVRKSELEKEVSNTKEDLVALAAEITSMEKDFKNYDVNSVNVELATLRMYKKDAENTRQDATLEMQLAVKAEQDIKDASVRLVELHNEHSKIAEEKDSIELLKEALSPRGVKATVVDFIVPQLEDRINEVLGKMSDFRIRLDTQKATADDEGVKEGLFITVLNDRKEELPFSSYSGGEKVKITVAISEALASLMPGIGFRVMDENIISLDRESTESFVTVLEKLQTSFPQLLLISHLQEVKDLFETKITLRKINGISTTV